MSQLVAPSPKYHDFGASGVALGLVGAIWGVYSLERALSPAIVRRWTVVILLGFFIILGLLPDWLQAHSFIAAHLGGLLAGMVVGLVIPVRTTPAPVRRLRATLAIALIVLAGCAKIAGARHESLFLPTGRASGAAASESPVVPQPSR